MKLSFESRWTRSVHSAVAAQILADRCPEVPPGDAFTAALMQDIGILVIGCREPATYDGLETDSPHDEIVQAEIEALGVDHAAVGAELLEAWRLPDHVATAVRNSNDFDGVGEGGDLLSALVVIDGLVAEWIAGEPAALNQAAALTSTALGLDDQAFSLAIDEIGTAIPDLASLLDAEVPDPEMASDVIMVRQMIGQQAVTKLRGKLATMANIAADLEVENRIDPVTGLFNRRHLDEILVRQHHSAASRDTRSPSCFSTSTTSDRSTAGTATREATPSSPRPPNASPLRFETAISSVASAATSS